MTNVQAGHGPVTASDWAALAGPPRLDVDLHDWAVPPDTVAQLVDEYRGTVTNLRAARQAATAAKSDVADAEKQDLLAGAHRSRYGGKDVGFIRTQKAEAAKVDAERRQRAAELGCQHSLIALRQAIANNGADWQAALDERSAERADRVSALVVRLVDELEEAKTDQATSAVIVDATEHGNGWKPDAWPAAIPGAGAVNELRSLVTTRFR